jgi:hAT family C-terminal dimerisation region
MFSEVVKLLELFLLLPVTSATAERSFSGLRRLKTFMRICMSQELLNSLAILHVHIASA